MRKIFLLISVTILVISSINSLAKDPIKFGKIDMKDLLMDKYEKDTSAPAVILCDYGYFNSNNFEFYRTVRIKILKPSGLSFANYSYVSNDKTTTRGYTYNLVNGKIEKVKLKNQSIYTDKVTRGFSVIRVAMPNVKVGSIIDIEYVSPGMPREWKFQYTIPVKWSELRLEKNQYIHFNSNFYGYVPLFISEPGRWAAKDVPAFRIEPYLNSPENYITKFEFDILDIHIPQHEKYNYTFPQFYQGVTTSWDAVNKVLLDDGHFGKNINESLYLNDIASEINNSTNNKLDKLKLALDSVKTIKWNEKERLYTSVSLLKTVYKNGTGNSADINLMLVQLLKKLDIEAYPVALSTLENGILSDIQPSIDKLNYVIACAIIDDKEYLIDATAEYLPLGILPPRCINIHGRLIDSKKSRWVDLTTDTKDYQTTNYSLKLNQNGELIGRLNCIKKDYGAYYFRKKINKFNIDKEFIKDLESKNPGLIVNDYQLKDIDSVYLPTRESYNVDLENRVSLISDKIYLDPMLTDQITENPFKIENRKYPVDFIHPIKHIYVLNLQIPDNYVVENIPKSTAIKLPDNSADFLYNIVSKGNIIQLRFQLDINKPIFLTDQYKDLREFYNQIIKKQSEQIILAKKDENI